jgi:hypothetical protein
MGLFTVAARLRCVRLSPGWCLPVSQSSDMPEWLHWR